MEDQEHPNAFVPLPPNPNEMIMDVSDAFHRWANNVLKAGKHRVTVPNEMKDEAKTILKERFSMAYFFKAERQLDHFSDS